MPCLLGCLILAFPRVAIVLIFLFSTYLQRALPNMIWLIVGFIFLPLTTLAYAFAINTNGSVQGVYFVIVLVAVILDLGLHGGAEFSRRRAS